MHVVVQRLGHRLFVHRLQFLLHHHLRGYGRRLRRMYGRLHRFLLRNLHVGRMHGMQRFVQRNLIGRRRRRRLYRLCFHLRHRMQIYGANYMPRLQCSVCLELW